MRWGVDGGITTIASDPILGIIGGSGLYQIDGLEGTQWIRVDSPFGAPSDELLFGTLGGQKLVFLPRHGRGHRIPPHEINFRANIDALKRAGCTQIISVSAVGSLRAELPPGTFVVVDQFIDRTIARAKSFFSTGLVGHVAFGHPVCARIGDALEAAARQAKVPTARGGTLVVMEGPQFSTVAESNLHRGWSADLIGMTAMPEAKLAREAELCYATMAMVTDYDSWNPDHDHVTVDAVVQVMVKNADNARAVLRIAAPRLKDATGPCPHGCDRALDHAIMTAPEARDPKLMAKLDAVAGRVLR